MNTNNIIKLIKAYFYENWQKDVLYSFTLVAVLATLNMAFGIFSFGFVLCVAVVLMVVYPSRLFSKLYQPSSRMQYLMIPASNNEKVVANMLLVNIYYVIGIVLSLCVGVLLGCLIGYLIDPEMVRMHLESVKDNISDLTISGTLPILCVFASIATMFFASIYFKKNPIGKLILTGFVVTLALGAIMACTDWLNFVLTVPAEIRNGNYFKTEHYIATSSDWFPYVACGVSIVYFYAMSFLRMRETEA